jgi:hypothetical protein
MPSATHQAIVTLLLEQPELLGHVLAPVAPPGLPVRARVRAAPAAFLDLRPPSYHADLVLRVEDGRGRLLHVFIVEVQLRRDRGKHVSWPLYITAARAEVGLDCPVTLVVLALSEAVARWCARPIALDTQGSVVVPLVLGPEIIPRIVDVDRARAQPELAVLSAVVHARSAEAPEIATAALIACRTLDRARGGLYADMVEARLDAVARRAVEKLMEIQGYRLQTPFARAHFAAGRKKGREEGRQEGREEGRKKGLQEGGQEALARMLAIQLERRFGPIPRYAARVIEAADVDTLIALGARVLDAASLDEVVARPARRRTRTRGPAASTRKRGAAAAASARTRKRGPATRTRTRGPDAGTGTPARKRGTTTARGRTRSRASR